MTSMRLGGVVGALAVALMCVPSAASAPPANDDFENAAALSGGVGTVTDSLVDATHQANEPLHAGQEGTGSIWYSWTAPGDLRATFDTCGSGAGIFLAVYTGSVLSSLALVGGSDDACDFRGRVEFDAVAGTTYRIAVDSDGYWDEAILRWETTPLYPRNTTPPTITGQPLTNATLAALPGTWVHGAPYAYIWFSCPPENTAPTPACKSIDRGTEPTDSALRIPTSELGRRIYVDEYARGPSGVRSRSSALTAVVGVGPPRNTGPPSVDGYTIVGRTLEASEGSWDLGGGSRVSVSYLWQRCNLNAENCRHARGPDAENKYVVTAADLGSVIQAVVTMTTNGGSTSAVAFAAGEVTLPERKPRQQRCVVPRLVGKGLKAARKLLSRGRCKLGKVSKVRSGRKAGVIIAQRPKPGTRLRAGAKVNVVLSLGRRR